MRHLERHRRERALRPVAGNFVSPNPVVALVLALHVAATGATVSPLIGWPRKASPSAVQSFRVPVSKSRLSGLPLASMGRTPSGALGGAFGSTANAEARRNTANTTSIEKRRMATLKETSDGRGTGLLSGARDGCQRSASDLRHQPDREVGSPLTSYQYTRLFKLASA